MSAYAVVPVKTLLKSKTRLSNFFTLQERPLFTLAMLEDVLKALKSSKVERTVVVSSDSTVECLVKNFGMTFLNETKVGLNQALNQAVKWCVKNKAEQVLVLPADVPLVTSKDIDHTCQAGGKQLHGYFPIAKRRNQRATANASWNSFTLFWTRQLQKARKQSAASDMFTPKSTSLQPSCWTSTLKQI